MSPVPALCLLLALTVSLPAGAEPPRDPQSKVPIAADADPGERKIAALAKPLAEMIRGQPYGARWHSLVRKDPPPKGTKSLGSAKTHPDLEHDEIEMQAQAHFLEETGVEVRYGTVSVRCVRVFGFGRLLGVQLVIDRIGRGDKQLPEFLADLAVLRKAWTDPIVALGLEKRYKLVRNDLAKKRGAWSGRPLLLEIEPIDRS